MFFIKLRHPPAVLCDVQLGGGINTGPAPCTFGCWLWASGACSCAWGAFVQASGCLRAGEPLCRLWTSGCLRAGGPLCRLCDFGVPSCRRAFVQALDFGMPSCRRAFVQALGLGLGRATWLLTARLGGARAAVQRGAQTADQAGASWPLKIW
jgi:hypothetical protein